MTDREAILQALFARLQTVADATVLRNEVLPERIPDGGLIILRDGDPGERKRCFRPCLITGSTARWWKPSFRKATKPRATSR
jgi:hypothetical protein